MQRGTLRANRGPDELAVARPLVGRPGRLPHAAVRRRALGRRAETALALVLALAFAAALLGPHVARGGRHLDDWWLGVSIRFPDAAGFGSAHDYLGFYSGARPGAVAYWLATYDLFGFHDAWHRGLSAALAAGLATVTYALMRELRFGRVDAAAVALLTLALPVADAIHFWITPAVAQLCLAAWAGGMLLALRALDMPGRTGLKLHAASLALLAASLLCAETMLPLIGLSLLVYRTRCGWRAAARRWAVDLLLAGAATIHYALDAPVRLGGAATSDGSLAHARAIADQLVTLVTALLAPLAPSRAPVLAAFAAGALLVAVQLRRARRAGRDAEAARVRGWLVAAGLAALLALASYAVYVPADPSYLPLTPGVGNRVNIGALLPLSVLALALVRLLGGLPAGARARTALTAALFAAVLVPALHELRGDRALWTAAANEQRSALAALHAALPAPPRGTALLVINAPGVVTRFGRIGHARVNEPVPVFSTWWELDAAVKLSYGRADLSAYPLWADQPPQIVCGANDVYQLGLDGVRHALAYGRVYVVDADLANATLLNDRARCEQATGDATTLRYDLPV